MARRQELDKAEQTAQKIEELRQAVLQGGITAVTRGKLLTSISLMKDSLDALSREIDPVRMPDSFFDPTEPRLIGHFVALALIAQERQALKDLTKFYGAGVYAIYYTGDADLYAPISRTETPIYVGKADPNANAKTLIEQGTKLADRLNEHRKSIGKASTTLDIADFECRALAVQSGYQAAAESHLIRLFKPIWNNETRILFGIGKHGDSAETRANNKSPWDTLHPGRKWADANTEAKTANEIRAEVAKHFAEATIFKRTEDVFAAFAAGIRRADQLGADPEDEVLSED